MRGQRSLRFLPTAAALLLREDRALLRAAPAPLPLRAAAGSRLRLGLRLRSRAPVSGSGNLKPIGSVL